MRTAKTAVLTSGDENSDVDGAGAENEGGDYSSPERALAPRQRIMGHDWHRRLNKSCRTVIRMLALIKIQPNKETSDYLNLERHSTRWLCLLNSLFCFSIQEKKQNKTKHKTTQQNRVGGGDG